MTIHETVIQALRDRVDAAKLRVADAQHELDSAQHMLAYAESQSCACGRPGIPGMVHAPGQCVSVEDASQARARISLGELVQPAEAAAPGVIPPAITGSGAFGNPYPGPGPTPTTVMPQTGDTIIAPTRVDPPAPFDSLPDLEAHRVEALERFNAAVDQHRAETGDDT